MAQYQSSLGQVGFRHQSAVGTANAPVATADPSAWLKITQSTVGSDRSLLIPDPEIGGAGARDVPKVYLGPTAFSGDYEFYTRSEAIGLLAYGALGAAAAPTQPGGAATPTATTGYQHVITPADTLPAFTTQEVIGNTFDTMQYVDVFFNTLHLECAADGYYMGKLGVAAITGTAGNTPVASPGFDATPLIVGSKIVVTIGGTYATGTNVVTAGTAFAAQNFSFDFSNQLETNHFVLGSLFVDAMTPKRREVTGSLTLRPQANTYFRQAVFGTSGTQTSITGLTVVTNINIAATTYEIISGASANVYTVTLNIAEAILAPHKVSPNRDNVVEESFDFRGVKVTGSNVCSLVVSNGVATAYTDT